VTDAATRAAAGRATFMVALSAAGFAAIAIFVIFATRAGASLLTILSWRYIIAAIVLGTIAGVAGSIRRVNGDGLRVLVVAGLGQSIIAVVTLMALRYIPAATLAFLFYTYPGWVAVIARVRKTEPLTALRLFALALSFAGIFVMVGAPGSAELHPIGISLALIGALLYAIYVPVLGVLQRDLPAVATAAYMSAGAAIMIGVVAFVRGELLFRLHPTAWAAILGLALISTAGAFLVFLRGLRVLGPVRTAIVSTVEPFFTAILSAWFLNQQLTTPTLAGGALIAVAVLLLQVPPRPPLALDGPDRLAYGRETPREGVDSRS
jgi:drug/metabolite transporter (DMT)-like permease